MSSPYESVESNKTDGFFTMTEVPLEEVCDFIMRGKHPDYVDDSDIRVLNQKALRWDKIEEEHLKYHNPDTDMFENRFLKTGDIAINSTGVGTLGRVFYFDKDPGELFADSHVTIIRTDEDLIHPEYLYYILKSPEYQKKIQNIAVGSTGQIELNKGELTQLKISFPDLETQKLIIDLINPIDSKIGTNRGLNKNLEAVVQTLFEHHFVDFGPYDNFKNTGIGEIPESFEIAKFGDICSTRGGGTPNTDEEDYWNGNNLWLTPSDVTSIDHKIAYDTDRKITDSGVDNSSTKIMSRKSVLLTSRATVGEVVVNREPMGTNQGFICMDPNERVEPYFLSCMVVSKRPEIENRASGSTYDEISQTSFNDIDVFLPPKEDIEAFEKAAESIYDEIYNLELQNENLTSLRDTLLPKLMSGELRVDNLELDELNVDSEV